MTYPRASSAGRGYGRAWRKARLAFLNEHPLCVSCFKLGRTVAATTVDHVVPARDAPDRFWDESNWQSLCTSCHSGHKQSLDRTGHVRGCDADGNPLDDRHWEISQS